jgi:hypothetical protein
VRYAEFRLRSCHRGPNKLIHIGKHLVPFLSTYMPRLQTLRLWRPDDFPWTTGMYILDESKSIQNYLFNFNSYFTTA